MCWYACGNLHNVHIGCLLHIHIHINIVRLNTALCACLNMHLGCVLDVHFHITRARLNTFLPCMWELTCRLHVRHSFLHEQSSIKQHAGLQLTCRLRVTHSFPHKLSDIKSSYWRGCMNLHLFGVLDIYFHSACLWEPARRSLCTLV